MTIAQTRPRKLTVKSATLVLVRSRIWSRNPQRAARQSLLWMLIFMAISHVVLTQGMDYCFPSVRDPEYGRRLSRYSQRVAEHPGRTTIVLLGSSRTAQGVCPETIHEANPSGPRVFNFSLFGSGPVMQVMVLRRLLADGHVPQAVLMEYWPAFLRGDDRYSEEHRIDPHRLLPEDVPFVRDYFANAELAEATMRHVRRVTWYEHRTRLMSQIVPGWLPWEKRLDGPWGKLSRWGWLPGADEAPTAAERYARVNYAELYYRPLFESYQVAPEANRAIEELVRTCRERQIPVAMLWLPESSEFSSWIGPAQATIQNHLEWVRDDLKVPMIDGRHWVEDHQLTDGFHLAQPGAVQFSQRLAAELPSFFPQTSGRQP